MEQLPFEVRVQNALATHNSLIEEFELALTRYRSRLDRQIAEGAPIFIQRATWTLIRLSMGKLKFARQSKARKIKHIKDGSFPV